MPRIITKHISAVDLANENIKVFPLSISLEADDILPNSELEFIGGKDYEGYKESDGDEIIESGEPDINEPFSAVAYNKESVEDKETNEFTNHLSNKKQVNKRFWLCLAVCGVIAVSSVVSLFARGQSSESNVFEKQPTTEAIEEKTVIKREDLAAITIDSFDITLSESKLGDVAAIEYGSPAGIQSADITQLPKPNSINNAICLPEQESGYQKYFFNKSTEFIEISVINNTDISQPTKNCAISKIRINKVSAPSYDISSYGLFSWESTPKDLIDVFDVEPFIYEDLISLYTFELDTATYNFTFENEQLVEIEVKVTTERS